ncbi:MAG TPA: hypothetical protein VEU29_03360 [Actinomycetota bacterium]|nr:hypothetical protein [Actinomycetota bacterium]
MAASLGAFMLLQVTPAQASAPEMTQPEGSMSMNIIDVWDISGDTITGVAGPRTCSVTASTPVVSANQMAGSGSTSCNKTYAKMTITVCIQAKQAFVAEQTTWEDVRCNPTKAALNSSGLNDTARAQCLPGAMLYRTRVVAEGFNADSSDPQFLGILHSGSTLQDCFL